MFYCVGRLKGARVKNNQVPRDWRFLRRITAIRQVALGFLKAVKYSKRRNSMSQWFSIYSQSIGDWLSEPHPRFALREIQFFLQRCSWETDTASAPVCLFRPMRWHPIVYLSFKEARKISDPPLHGNFPQSKFYWPTDRHFSEMKCYWMPSSFWILAGILIGLYSQGKWKRNWLIFHWGAWLNSSILRATFYVQI